jgi:hypothetical protein
MHSERQLKRQENGEENDRNTEDPGPDGATGVEGAGGALPEDLQCASVVEYSCCDRCVPGQFLPVPKALI